MIVDNRQGIRPRRVTLAGTDPERAVRVLLLAAGGRRRPRADRQGRPAGWRPTRRSRARGHPAVLGVRIGRREGGRGRWHVHPVIVAAAARRAADAAAGPERRPGAQPRQRVATVFADNRGGSRPRRVQFGGHDPERVIRFDFSPPVIDLAPGQAGARPAADQRAAARRRRAGQPAVHRRGIRRLQGHRRHRQLRSGVESDRRPLWRILLTLLGAPADDRRRLPGLEHRTCGQLDSGQLDWERDRAGIGDCPLIDVASNRPPRPGVTLIDLPDSDRPAGVGRRGDHRCWPRSLSSG